METHLDTEAVTALMAALSDPTRLGALRLLWDGREHCVCELMERLSATQSRMSRHMAALKGVGLVVDRREAQWVRYRRNPALAPAVTAIVDAVLAALPAGKTAGGLAGGLEAA
ncbi:ArsR/SmtB family transcription factor [Azospirillum thermophilum]|uniref:Transcriptional regulator n=1 Tax=Azospirillum thermophilum TaxID=2202148 RepID=A0A2S2CMF3_9PROT|nr:metalloregulator ArsR/SmtB family transcription factor [Azospirillum thermophilum]AWK85693.1 transcriptional regulator [Azospirillum thermophilum]